VETFSPIQVAIDQLQSLNFERNNKRKSRPFDTLQNCFDLLRNLGALRFLRLVQEEGRTRVVSSELVASVVFGKHGASYRARSNRDWVDHFPSSGVAKSKARQVSEN
jgi:hypothetical protein